MRTITLDIEKDSLVKVRSADGWSLHMPGSTDEDIASGDAPYLVSGEGKITDADYDAAAAKIVSKEAPWADKWAWVEGGIKCWESADEYRTWMAQV